MRLFRWILCYLSTVGLARSVSFNDNDNKLTENKSEEVTFGSISRTIIQPSQRPSPSVQHDSSKLIFDSSPSAAAKVEAERLRLQSLSFFDEKYTEHEKELKMSYRMQYPFSTLVDTFFGTEGGGHMFPGTTLPFAMCKMGVDVIDITRTDAYSGYLTNGEVVGISMLHESGTGGSPTYGAVSQLPMMVRDINEIDVSKQIGFQRRGTDSGHVGYYKVRLNNSVVIEFSSNERSGLYQYRFPTLESAKPVIMVNVTHHLHSYGRPWWTQNFEKGYIQVHKDMQSYSGKVIISGGWSDPAAWVVSFYGIFDRPAVAIRTFQGSKFVSGKKINFVNDRNKNIGLFFEFQSGVKILKSHVGISFNKDRGIDYAKKNIAKDYPDAHKFDMDWSVSNALERWDKEVFQKIELIPSKEDPLIVEKLYTALYGVHLMPTDKSGAEAPWRTKEPYYDDWFTIWDTFRCLHPLLNILNQDRSAKMVRSLIEIWRNEGYMPDGRSGGRSGRTQGGSNADIVLADAFVKNITKGIDWADGFQAMKTNAEVPPPYVYDQSAPDSTNKYGRGALADWLKYGYVTRKYSRSVTRTIEYSYNDFALYQVARGLGLEDDAQKYLQRSSNWQNLWNPDASSSRFSYTGFIQPKDKDGNFEYVQYDPLMCFGCYWQDDEYEGKPVEYGWAVPHDIETLRKFIGSDDLFEKRLDDMFGLRGQSLADIGNEPSFLTPYLYNFINRQDSTAETIHFLIETYFKTGPKGLPGNSDAGAMQAWLFFGLIGFYPIAGTDIYLISGPKVSHLKLVNLPNLGPLEIVANNLYRDGQKTAASRNKYIQSVSVNGFNLTRNWLFHDELFSEYGSRIVFEMSEFPLNWDKAGPPPPSIGHYERTK